jgi:hypothetical protein
VSRSVRIILESTGCQRASCQSGSDFGSLPNAFWRNSDGITDRCWRQAAANYRLVPQSRDAPQI